jgi:hypothetical protein
MPSTSEVKVEIVGLCALCKGRFMRPPLNHFWCSLSVFHFAQQAAGERFALLDFANDFLSNHSVGRLYGFL